MKSSKMLEVKNAGFAFADINCSLCAKIGDKFHYFDGEKDLMDILEGQNLNGEGDEEKIDDEGLVTETEES